MKKVFFLTVVLVLLALSAGADMRDTRVGGGTIPNPPGPQNDIWFTDVFWEFPSAGEENWYGVGCSWHSGPLRLWCADFSNFEVYEFDMYGSTISSFPISSDDCDPDGHCYVEDDPDIGASDSLFIGDYGTFEGNTIDIYDDISTSPTHRDYDETEQVLAITYSPEFNVIYYGAGEKPDTVLTWADLTESTITQVGTTDVTNLKGLAYIPEEGGHPPLLIMISEDLWLSILELDDTTGYVTSTYWNGWDQIALPAGFTLPGGCDWDGDHLWVVDQPAGDWIFMIGLEGLSPSINVQPTSIGVIKAKFY